MTPPFLRPAEPIREGTWPPKAQGNARAAGPSLWFIAEKPRRWRAKGARVAELECVGTSQRCPSF